MKKSTARMILEDTQFTYYRSWNGNTHLFWVSLYSDRLVGDALRRLSNKGAKRVLVNWLRHPSLQQEGSAHFRINEDHPLAEGLVYANLGPLFRWPGD